RPEKWETLFRSVAWPKRSAQIQEYRARTRCKGMTPARIRKSVQDRQGGIGRITRRPVCSRTPQKETNAPVDRRLKTASGGGGGLEAEGGISRFRLWYMERFA
ncbi:hypothetical protein, partial [Rhizomicrobium electricum]|uniref:hypothetical protein n=1 Tax=Rhizomicrobium electricum TaxID=480070 RepID=UPI0031DEC125